LQSKADELELLPVIVVPLTRLPEKVPVVEVTDHVTCAFGTGLPLASVTLTMSGSKNGRPVIGQPSQIICPLPCKTEMFAAVCARPACARIITANRAANTTNFNLTKANLLKIVKSGNETGRGED
jgi:hypothetical protein